MRVVLNRAACSGHGRCYSLAPEVFEADEEGNSVLRFSEVPVELEDKARIGELNCPERAITIEE